ncbi:MAG: serine/threonine-protein kinase [Pirellulaceae bacterium]
MLGDFSLVRLEIEEICDKFEARLRKNQPLPIEEFANNAREELRNQLVRELLRVEWDVRREKGSKPEWNEYANRGLLPDEELAAEFSNWTTGQNESARGPQRFELLEKLGSGSFGIVWKAFDRKLQRLVALKLAHPSIVSDGARFLREAITAGRLSHGNIVRILDAGEDEEANSLFIVREYVDGHSLDQVLRDRPMPPREAAEIALAMSRALTHSHSMGCIHRDIKPQNIILARDGRPMLVDFGLAKVDTGGATATLSGTIVGTPAFMSPEQASGDIHQVDERSDLYSLGAVLYTLLSRVPPFQGAVNEVLVRIATTDPLNPHRQVDGLPVDLVAICMKCLEKKPAARYASAANLSDDLVRHLAGQPVSANPIGPIARAARWIRRNPGVSAMMSTIMALLAIVASGSLMFAISTDQALKQETNLRREADLAKLAARKAADDARKDAQFSQEITAFMQDLISTVDPAVLAYTGTPLVGDPGIPAGQLLERATRRLMNEPVSQPRTQARLLDSVASIHRSLGDFKRAEELLALSTTIREEFERQSPETNLNDDWGEHWFFVGILRHTMGDYAAADAAYRKAFDRYKIDQPGSLKIANVEFQMGWLFLERRRPIEAREHFERALAIRKANLNSESPAIWVTQIAIAHCSPIEERDWQLLAKAAGRALENENLAELVANIWSLESAKKRRNWNEAVTVYEKIIEVVNRRLPQEHPISLLVHGDFADVLSRSGNYRRGLSIIEQTMQQALKMAPRHEKIREALVRLAHEYHLARRLDDAKACYQKLSEIGQPSEPGIVSNMVINYAQFLHDIGEPAQGLQWLKDNASAITKTSSVNGLLRDSVELALLKKLGKTEDAHAVELRCRQALESIDTSQFSTEVESRIGNLAEHLGELKKAELLYRQALEREIVFRPENHPRIADRQFTLAAFLLQHVPGHEKAESRLLLENCLKARRLNLPDNDVRIPDAEQLLQRTH